MSQSNGASNGYPKNAITETTLLIPPGPSTVDASLETVIDEETDSLGHDEVSDQEDHTTPNQKISASRLTVCALALALLVFLQATNLSLLTTTQSPIAADLDCFDKTTWFTSAYLIAMSSLTPLTGKLAAVFSPRLCIFASALILAVGGVVSSLASGFTGFVVGRAISGIGAGVVFTVSIIVVLELTGSKRRGVAIGLLNSGYTLGVAIGATAAGALLPVVGWRALFWAQAPIAILSGTVLLFSVPRDFTTGSKKSTRSSNDEECPASSISGPSTLILLSRLDYLGALMLAASIFLFLYALSAPHAIPILPIVLSPIVLAAFILNEVYLAHDPIIPIALLRSRGLLLTCLSTVGYMMARWCVLFYAPTYAIAVRGWSPASAGSILVPTNVGFAFGGLAVGYLHVKRQGSFYIPSLVVYIIFPFTIVALAFLSTHTSSVTLYVLVVLAGGAATGAALNYTLAHLLHLTPKNTHYIATSLVATFRGFAGSFGAAIGGGIFTRTLNTSLIANFATAGIPHREVLIRRLLGSPALVGQLTGVEKDTAVLSYETALKTLFLAAAGLAAVIVLVQAGTGWEGHEAGEGRRRGSALVLDEGAEAEREDAGLLNRRS